MLDTTLDCETSETRRRLRDRRVSAHRIPAFALPRHSTGGDSKSFWPVWPRHTPFLSQQMDTYGGFGPLSRPPSRDPGPPDPIARSSGPVASDQVPGPYGSAWVLERPRPMPHAQASDAGAARSGVRGLNQHRSCQGRQPPCGEHRDVWWSGDMYPRPPRREAKTPLT